MSRIFWDTNLYIYLIEGKSSLAQQVVVLRKKMLARGDQLLTSTLTLGEVLVKPLQMGDLKLSSIYEKELTLSSVLIPFDAKAAGTYARLRSDRSLRAPDAIQLACASTAGVDLFITNDVRLHSKQIQGIQFIVPLDRVPI
jgi:predicted nucleic acid-binding protein